MTIPTTFSNGCLGSHNDDERSEMRYVMRIAKLRESLKFWTHIAPSGNAWGHTYLSVYIPHSSQWCMSCMLLEMDYGFECCASDLLYLNVYGKWVLVYPLIGLPALVRRTLCTDCWRLCDRLVSGEWGSANLTFQTMWLSKAMSSERAGGMLGWFGMCSFVHVGSDWCISELFNQIGSQIK